MVMAAEPKVVAQLAARRVMVAVRMVGTAAASVAMRAAVGGEAPTPDQCSGAALAQSCTARWRCCACSAGTRHSSRHPPFGARMLDHTRSGCRLGCRTIAEG